MPGDYLSGLHVAVAVARLNIWQWHQHGVLLHVRRSLVTWLPMRVSRCLTPQALYAMVLLPYSHSQRLVLGIILFY